MKVRHFLLLAILISACAPLRYSVGVTKQFSSTPVVSAAPSAPSVVSQFPTIMPTQQIALTLLASPTVIASVVPIPPGTLMTVMPSRTADQDASPTFDAGNLPLLRDVALTEADFLAEDTRWTVKSIFETVPISRDVTSEAEIYCLLDCVKTIWQGESRNVTIMMLRAGNSEKAKRTVKSLSSEFNQITDDYADERKFIEAPRDGTFIYTVGKIVNFTLYEQIVIGTVRGPVVLLIVADLDSRTDDVFWQVIELTDLVNLQFEKLKRAGFPD